MVVKEGRLTHHLPSVVTFAGHAGPQRRFMGVYEMDPNRVVRRNAS